jgi:hypothetical protein
MPAARFGCLGRVNKLSDLDPVNKRPVDTVQHVRIATKLNPPDAPEIPVPGTGYSLFTGERGAAFFTESDALQVQYRLRKMGVDTQLR